VTDATQIRANTAAASRPIRILKIDNKGRHNRRVRIGLQDV
jgi:misacylated tRNA(Ala) deacylase